MDAFTSNKLDIEAIPGERRQSAFRLTPEMIERSRKASPHLYPLPNTPFLFAKDVAHLLGMDLSEIKKISKSSLPRFLRQDGQEIFVTADVIAFVRSNNSAPQKAEILQEISENSLLTVEEVAKQLRVSANQIRKLADNGDLKFINVGAGSTRSQKRFSIENVEEFRALRKVNKCQYTSARVGKRTLTTSNAAGLDIQATREQLRNAKRKK